MKPLKPEDLFDLTRYELERAEYRASIIALKRARRVTVGNELAFVFENHDTVRFQVQEMLRTERIVKPDAIQHELDVYNALLPGDFELSATLFVEIQDKARIRPTLDRLVGIDEHVFLDVGDESVQATFDPKQFEQDRISAVQYVRFPLGPQLAARFRDESVRVVLRAAHPAYTQATEITGAARRSLCEDLRLDPRDVH